MEVEKVHPLLHCHTNSAPRKVTGRKEMFHKLINVKYYYLLKLILYDIEIYTIPSW